jgi:hypothetical protein
VTLYNDVVGYKRFEGFASSIFIVIIAVPSSRYVLGCDAMWQDKDVSEKQDASILKS